MYSPMSIDLLYIGLEAEILLGVALLGKLLLAFGVLVDPLHLVLL